MSKFEDWLVGAGHVDGESSVIIHNLNTSISGGFSADYARRIADDLLRAANEIDPPEETNNEIQETL